MKEKHKKIGIEEKKLKSKPAPMIGESPTRPGIDPGIPPVDVPAAIFPYAMFGEDEQ